MAKTNNLQDFLIDLADGIRTVDGGTKQINPQDFRNHIEDWQTIRAQTLLTSEKNNNTLIFTANNPQTTGYVTANTNKDTATKTISLNVSGGTVTASDGTNSIAKTVASGSAVTPETTIVKKPVISIDESGLITASVSGTQSVTPTVTAGYVSSGTAGTITVSGSNTKKLTLRTKNDLVANNLTVTAPEGYYHTSAVKTLSDNYLKAENIKKGITIFGTTGTYEVSGLSLNTYKITIVSTIGNTTIYYIGGDGKQYSKVITSAQQSIYVAENTVIRVVSPEGTNCKLSGVDTYEQINENNIAYLYLPVYQQVGTAIPNITITITSSSSPGGATLNVCSVIVTFNDNPTDAFVSATTYSDGAIGKFYRQVQSNTTFTISNVVCGSQLFIYNSNFCSIYDWPGESDKGVAPTSYALTVPSLVGTYTAIVGPLDD